MDELDFLDTMDNIERRVHLRGAASGVATLL